MNNEEDEFKRIEREALRRAASEFALPQLREFLNELNDRIARRYQGSDKDQDIAYGMEIVYVDLLDLIGGKK
jgi:predicted HTH domain antitoxin